MTDQIRKTATIHSIENLQLSHTLISALDNAHDAEQVVEAVEALMAFSNEWS